MTQYNFQNQGWITYVTYDDETKVMTIHTNVRTYEMPDVPIEVFEAFDRSSSRGKFFNENIKGKYQDKWFK